MKKEELLKSAQTLLQNQPNTIALLSNATAFLNESLNDINWVGFYLFDGKKLNVGPFQGKVACHTIKLGQGVCGQSALLNKTIVIGDVLTHDNHIACDSNSRSEVVIPIFINDMLFGVLDVDSPSYNRFDPETVNYLEEFIDLLKNSLTFKEI